MRRLSGYPGRLFRKWVSWGALNGPSRVEIWNMLNDLMEADLDIETAMTVTIRACRDQGQTLRPWVLGKWRRALLDGRFPDEAALWVPATEAMVIAGYGRVDAQRLFAAAARIAEARGRQKAALWSALVMPVALTVGILISLWLAGWQFIPVMAKVAPPSRWEMSARLFGEGALWVHANDVALGVWIAVGWVALRFVILNWSGPGRTLADNVPPFSLYRTIAGAAFLFVAIEFLRAGVDLNERTFGQLKANASRYTRSRIAAIERRMRDGDGLGASMVACGHRFPDPSLIAVVAALDNTEGWEERLAGFVDRWTIRSEELLRRRAGVLNMLLLTFAAAMMGVAIKGMFGMMSAASAGMGVR
ncbi:MAG: hypothetical protein OYH76_23515 [Defluviicoccus sp.]|nr:hypothetical protein [Defluviicoccus sp.]MDE0278875.1 hypothetical protein [Defluviicoccus sp.]